MPPDADSTRLLVDARGGDLLAAEALLPQVYDELRALAARRMNDERAGHTLEPTALVHEAYARLVDGELAGFHDRQHFFALAARSIRRVLVDHARARGAQRRGGDALRCTLATGLAADAPEDVQLRWFAGLDVKETAAALGVSAATIKSDWRAARACLAHWLGEGD
jgi:RNA polymerase sigma-70 factor (ECF subfamily)